MPQWRSVLTQPDAERKRQLADPAIRKRLRDEFDGPEARSAAFQWDGLEVEAVRDPANASWIGQSVTELAAQRDGADPLDTFLDVLPFGGPTDQLADTIERCRTPVHRACSPDRCRNPPGDAGI